MLEDLQLLETVHASALAPRKCGGAWSPSRAPDWRPCVVAAETAAGRPCCRLARRGATTICFQTQSSGAAATRPAKAGTEMRAPALKMGRGREQAGALAAPAGHPRAERAHQQAQRQRLPRLGPSAAQLLRLRLSAQLTAVAQRRHSPRLRLARLAHCCRAPLPLRIQSAVPGDLTWSKTAIPVYTVVIRRSSGLSVAAISPLLQIRTHLPSAAPPGSTAAALPPQCP